MGRGSHLMVLLRGSGIGLVLILLSACAQVHSAVDPARFEHLWDAYAKHFIDPQGRVIDRAYPDQRTTSESQAYAMFFALAANQPTRFARLLSWTQANLAGGELGERLPAWLWGKRANGEWGVLDPNSASDADLWMAYTLLQAGRLWHQDDYTRLGRRLAATIALKEVVDIRGQGPMLLPGREGFGPHADGCYTFNPSYVPLPLLTALGRALGAPWSAMAKGLPGFMEAVAARGFAPNWVRWCPKGGYGPPERYPNTGSYDAIRVYLWAGMTPPDTQGARGLMAALWGMANYLHLHAQPPVVVDMATGVGQGDGPVGFSAALLPYLHTLGTSALMKRQLKIVERERQADGLYGQPAHYYDQNLTLFALGYLGGVYRFDPDGKLEVNWR
ncbi:cellulose synthase complex periplasmic endoglucanase BcsZ [Acidihalobacter prosperus]|uniref:cellulase n=1 Tax=Acidihalobacter prosperus TaxID=160660 RepID=A0A1A6C3B8_9GAMM|nr:cellulose synthase complex periplasmic endoglucanase BcsZ [Acidihalobacter prosperus]OBS09054.1 endoglucanase [Acidihalobacter prosperus]